MRQIRTSGSTRGRVTKVVWPADLLPLRPKGLTLWKSVAYASLVSLSTLLVRTLCAKCGERLRRETTNLMRIGFDISQTGNGKAGCGYFADSITQQLAKLDSEN